MAWLRAQPPRTARARSNWSTCVGSLFLLTLPLAALPGPAWVPAVARRATGEWGRSATAEELEAEVPTLYVYDHCPYCVRARMIFGLKKTPFKLDFLMNDDVVTPTRMIGKKVLPIMEIDGEAMGESLDIVSKVDALDDTPILSKAAGRKDISTWLSDNKDLLRKITRQLALSRNILTCPRRRTINHFLHVFFLSLSLRLP